MSGRTNPSREREKAAQRERERVERECGGWRGVYTATLSRLGKKRTRARGDGGGGRTRTCDPRGKLIEKAGEFTA